MILIAPLFRVLRKDDAGYRAGSFKLTSAMVYDWKDRDSVIRVPAGTVTDFASIPRPFRGVISQNGAHRLPAVLHDYLYAMRGKTVAHNRHLSSVDELSSKTLHYTRKEADLEFRRAMLDEGVSRIKAAVMYRAVRLFGGVHLSLTSQKKWGT